MTPTSVSPSVELRRQSSLQWNCEGDGEMWHSNGAMVYVSFQQKVVPALQRGRLRSIGQVWRRVDPTHRFRLLFGGLRCEVNRLTWVASMMWEILDATWTTLAVNDSQYPPHVFKAGTSSEVLHASWLTTSVITFLDMDPDENMGFLIFVLLSILFCLYLFSFF